RALLERAMQYSGAVRLDHVLGLKRLYLIPSGAPPDNGIYVRLPFETLLEIVAQESLRHRCIVIGEDLGTVPYGLRERPSRFGIWRYHVLIVERWPDVAFLSPNRYARDALVTNTTHDLPTFSAWRDLTDIELRRTLGLDIGETEEDRGAAHAYL